MDSRFSRSLLTVLHSIKENGITQMNANTSQTCVLGSIFNQKMLQIKLILGY